MAFLENLLDHKEVSNMESIFSYIFIICAEYLGRSLILCQMFRKLVLVLKYPYVMFADDCLMFYEANRKAAWYVKDILKNYYKVSDQLVNFINMLPNSQKELKFGKLRH